MLFCEPLLMDVSFYLSRLIGWHRQTSLSMPPYNRRHYLIENGECMVRSIINKYRGEGYTDRNGC